MNLSTTGLHLSPDAPINLHLHTIHSDGVWIPEELFDHLVSEQFALVAITDHDRPDTAIATQQLAQDKGLPALVAAEMSATFQGEMTDLLCFGFDPAGSALHELAQDLLRRQQDNTSMVYERLLGKGYNLPASPEALASVLAAPSSRQPNALVAFLKNQGLGQGGGPSAGGLAVEAGLAFVLNEVPDVVDAAHRSGAVCIIAHPGHGDGFVTYDVSLLDQVRQEAPLDGLEVYHPKNLPAQTEMYLEYARRHGMLVSAGSDSHKPEKPPIKYRAGLCRDLLERLEIQVR
jgi:3',5'-nucleoside bisphosphate phosphatase